MFYHKSKQDLFDLNNQFTYIISNFYGYIEQNPMYKLESTANDLV